MMWVWRAGRILSSNAHRVLTSARKARAGAGMLFLGLGGASLAGVAVADAATWWERAGGAPATEVHSCGLGLAGQLGHGMTTSELAPKALAELKDRGVVGVYAGNATSAATTATGELFTWGRGDDGRLGHGDEADQVSPLPVEEFAANGMRAAKVSLGDFHTAVLAHDGTVWCTGRGWSGQIGDGSVDSCGTLQRARLPSGARAIDVAAGRQHTAAVTADGRLFTWGAGFEGATGQGVRDDVLEPQEVRGVANASSVCCGRDFTVVVGNDGAVYTCGADDYGQLGHGKHERFVREPKAVRGFGASGNKRVVQAAAGEYHVATLTDDGKVYTWGFGKDGQLGTGTTADSGRPRLVAALADERIVSLACGGGHTCAISDKGVAYVWGRGRDGQLGRGDKVESVAAYRALPQQVTALEGSRVVRAACGGDHTLFLTASESK